ncbi:ribosomal protein S18 acetylase RimI-like enzyme [Kitasatospora sp. MAP12-15]|uniref:GNAT family N-acetyltransferase n=1 Tax=unclassified Kitasatospora TaxID=2633591 RepID=UPI002475F0FA|nr:GNAT family N-acetyltransferase [Kitasatospora sp. MAP12-44]MDH6110282.1 ribosomal protein S18 acetylase RimI-like enzyme [Kitasatospora sp. MAP12-44]
MLIRPATPADLPALAALCADHARYERSGPVAADLAERLHPALFGAAPRLAALVLVAPDGELAGYATWSREFSTWTGAEYTHLDCLYVDAAHRSGGHGRRLIEAVIAETDAGPLQWQTPDWNTGAQRFYDRLGAHGTAKIRYTYR